MSTKVISYDPTDGLTYDPEDEIYWNEDFLKKEVTRIFEICHGCRMCFKFCDSFPNLFSFIDNNHNGDVAQLKEKEIGSVMDDCFQCKLCEVQCPYTPRDLHKYQLDFPKLVHRFRAIKKKKSGLGLREKLFAKVDSMAKLARLSFGLVNKLNRSSFHRYFIEKIFGIHRKKFLPFFAKQTFDKWADKNHYTKEDNAEVFLFQTCYVQHNEPQIGKDTLFVFKKNQIDTVCAKGLQCCGMPAWENGDLNSLRNQAESNFKILMPYVNKGLKIIVINPTCAMMMRREYPELLKKSHREDAKKLAEAIRDTGEYLWSIRKQERFCKDFKTTPGPSVGHHAPCHLRAQAVGFKGRDLLRQIPGVTPKLITQCCGHDGSYAMKKEYFDASKRIGKKAFDEMKQTSSQVWSTECPLAAIQFKQHASVKPMHPMTILAKAYQEDGFEIKIKENV